MLSLLASRRSCRSFIPKKVPDPCIEKLIHAALYAASSRAIRPWEFIIVEDTDSLAALSLAKAHGSVFLAGAPLAIVILGIPAESDVWIEDASIAAANILLAAESEGLGACWIQIRSRSAADGMSSEQKVRSILSIPEDRSVEAIIALGYPEQRLPAHTDQELLTGKVFRDRYQRNWYVP